jgi:peroxiredoxin
VPAERRAQLGHTIDGNFRRSETHPDIIVTQPISRGHHHEKSITLPDITHPSQPAFFGRAQSLRRGSGIFCARFSLKTALKKGPVVVYFYPSAFTKGCDMEAHAFAQDKEKFDAAGATIIGVSADSVARLNAFSADPEYCAGKFPVASDEDHKIAGSYDLTVNEGKPDMKDVRGEAIGHAFIERVTYVIGKDHKIVATLSSKDDKISPAEHVEKALDIVQKLAK